MKIRFTTKLTSLMLAAIMLLGAMSVMNFSVLAATETQDDLIFTAKEIYDLTEKGVWGDKYGCQGYDEVTLYKKNNTEFVRLLSEGGTGTAEAYFHLFYTAHKVAPVIAIKYRTYSSVAMEILTDSKNQKPVASSSTGFITIKSTGKWELVTFDLASKIADYNGTEANYLRFDFMNAATLPKNAYVDIEYIGFFNTAEEAKAYDEQNYKNKAVFVDPSSSYTASTLPYWSALDMINGMGMNGANTLSGRGGNSKNGVDRIPYGGTTFENNYLVFSGWSIVDGGISKYVWSADGGKTWNDTVLYNRTSIFNDSGTYVTAAQNNGLTFTDPTGAKNLAGYQCGAGTGVKCNGIAADLTAYKGKTVDVIFAAVPVKNTSTLCVLDCVENVYVGAREEQESFKKYEYGNDNSDVIAYANNMANGVDAYYDGYDRNKYTVENQNVRVNYNLATGGNSTVASITNPSGTAYIQNTMKVYARTTAGKTYYASNYVSAARPNIYRLGYYYYDVHFMDTDFVNSATVASTKTLTLSKFNNYSSSHSTKPTVSNGVLSITITNPLDAYVMADNLSYQADSYNAIQITVKSDSASSMDVLFSANDAAFSTSKGQIRYHLKSDGEWHTYTISTELWKDMGYTGEITGLRFDFDGKEGSTVQIKDIKVQNITYDKIPMALDRTMHTYSDKLHQEIHVVAYEDTTNIAAIGVTTEISESTVAKLIVKDKNGTHTSLNGVDWASAEYIAFDIKNAGIFGYILPFDGKSGGMKVTLSGGVYTITQEVTPNNGTILAPIYDTTNDFRMGQRIYTDTNHTFDAFLKEAEIERNPLTSENIVIDTNETPRSKFKGYDPIRGAYYFTLSGAANFNVPYYDSPNKHYEVSFGIKGDGLDRNIYVLTHTSSGALESAVLLDVDDMMLPVPLEVSKNFSEGEEPIYNCGDTTYGETVFPIALGGDETNYYTLINLYQNWGNYPLKQLSSIGYFVPYYHLSTGVTETNCISQYSTRGRNLEMLPDFRSMSQPFWNNQPQHYNAGHHTFLRYVDSNGNIIGTEYTNVDIGSYGPTYADVTTNYITDDGKIEVKLNHMEMPQTDENRGYYEIVYTVKEDVTISNFREDFEIYSFFGFAYYKYLGYLDETNNCTRATMSKPNGKTQDPTYYTLGTHTPYFDVYYMESATSYGNLAFVIDSSEIIIGGQKSDAAFAVKEAYQTVSLTLDIDGAVTLKKGDSIKIKAVIMPWGGGWADKNVVEFDPADYSVDVVNKTDADGKAYNVYHVNNDESVRRVRMELLANNGANIGAVTAVSDCTVVASTFLPTVKTSTGTTAEFTVKGGFDNYTEDMVNMTVLAKGFSFLNRPKVEELVDGNWVTYELSSKNSPDAAGNSHEYDGYSVTYENGKYNYSFVTTLTDTTARTFRITVEEPATKGFEYELNEDGKSLTIVGFDGMATSKLIIPEEYAGLSVTGIGSGAVVSEVVKNIKIPASITHIAPNNAFSGNFTGATVEIDADNAVYQANGNKITEKSTGKTVWLGSRYGNVNGDLGVSALDIMILRKFLVNYDINTGSSTITVATGADANGDGVVNTADRILLLKYFANYNYDTNTPGVTLGQNN